MYNSNGKPIAPNLPVSVFAAETGLGFPVAIYDYHKYNQARRSEHGPRGQLGRSSH